jgi:hypothetical protein
MPDSAAIDVSILIPGLSICGLALKKEKKRPLYYEKTAQIDENALFRLYFGLKSLKNGVGWELGRIARGWQWLWVDSGRC